MRRFLVGLICVGLLIGCQTQYAEFNGAQGVSAYPMGSNTYRITARGNTMTDRNVVLDYILLKSAETALSAGYTHFAIVNATDNSIRSVGTMPGFVSTSFSGGTASSIVMPASVYATEAPGADVMILVGNLKPGYSVGNGTYDARETFAAINPRVRRPGLG